MKSAVLSTALALLVSAGAASAASVTINITDYGTGAVGLDAARAAQQTFHDSILAVDDFEEFLACDGSNGPGDATPPCASSPVDGNVATYTTIGENSDPGGSSVGNPKGVVAVRDQSGFGRYNTTDKPGAKNFLDSQDAQGIEFTNFTGAFDKLSFLLMDVNDVASANFEIFGKSGDMEASETILSTNPRDPNGNLWLVTFDFHMPVDIDRITIKNVRAENDGFAIDDVTASVVPLPAGVWLLLGGLGGLAAMKRRKKS